MADALSRLEQMFDQHLVTRFQKPVKRCRSALPLCTALETAPMQLDCMLCDANFSIQAFCQALQISATLRSCICEGNFMIVLQLHLDMHTVNMARATWNWR